MKLRTGMMPPPNMPQPSTDDRQALLSWLETSLDKAAASKPNPGRTETLRRLNRTEYQNAIRDLLSVDIDAASLLPADESGHGFDNVTVGDLPRLFWTDTFRLRKKSARWQSGARRRLFRATSFACRPMSRRRGMYLDSLSARAAGCSFLYVRAERRA